jgi:hypothetical protein
VPDVDRLLNAIDAEEEHSYGSDSDGQLASERATAVDLYLGRNISPAPDGRSQVVDRSVYESIQWVKPSLSRIFANGDDVCELPPIGPEDEQGSKQEAQFLNHVLLQKNNWFQIFDTASTDALLTKAGYLHPYIETRRQVELEKYERQTPESLALIMQDQPEIVSQKEYPDPDYIPQPQPVPDPMTGQPAIGPDGQPVMMVPPAPMLYDVEVRRTKTERHYCVKVLPPERCKISQSTDTVQVSRGCPYFEYYDFVTISELREMGYKVEDDIADDESGDSEEDTARDQYSEQNWADKNQLDPSMRRVKCRWVWIRYDYDEDGIAELQFVVRVGRKMLHREELSRIPVAVLCADPLPHRHVGLCPADIVADIQQIKTAIIRQGLDNLYLSNNPQKFADTTQVNLDDMLVSRPGGVIRTKPGAVFGANFGVMQVPFVFPQAIEGLGYMDHVRETRTGVNNSFQGLDASQLTQLQPGTVNQISSMAAQRTEQIARNFANGVEELVSILHELILKSGHKKEVVQLRGQWVTVDPSTWRKRTDFRISVGFAAGNKDAQITRLMMIGNMQKEAMAGGLGIVTEENVYETMNELIKAADMQAPQRFLTHPSKAPPKQPPQPDPTVVAMEQMKAQSAEKIKGAELQSEQKVTQAKLEIDKYKADLASQTSLTIESMKQQHASELENARMQHAGQVEQFKAGHATNLKKIERGDPDETKLNEIGSKTEAVQKQLEQTVESMQDALRVLIGSKRSIRRGKDGRAEGVDILSPEGELIAQQKIARGPDGRALGTE